MSHRFPLITGRVFAVLYFAYLTFAQIFAMAADFGIDLSGQVQRFDRLVNAPNQSFRSTVVRTETLHHMRLTDIKLEIHEGEAEKRTELSAHPMTLIVSENVTDFRHWVVLITEDQNLDRDLLFDQSLQTLNKGAQGRLTGKLLSLIPYPVAVITRVPAIPPGGGSPDEFLGRGLVSYLNSGGTISDAAAIPLIGMTRAVLRGQEALAKYVQETHGQKLERTVLIGGSKTAWTAWLAAAHDRSHRISGIVSAAFNVLNFEESLPYEAQAWKGLPGELAPFQPVLDAILSPSGSPLRTRASELTPMIDPFYRLHNMTLPKLVIYGANDPYFPPENDALYWNALAGRNNHRIVFPNYGHHGDQPDGMSKLELYQFYALLGDSLRQFFRLSFDDRAAELDIPRLHPLEVTRRSNQVTLVLSADDMPGSAYFWIAESESKDLRKTQWRRIEAQWNRKTQSYTAVARSEAPYLSVFGEAHWSPGGLSIDPRFVEHTAIKTLFLR